MLSGCVLCEYGLSHGDRSCRSWDTPSLAPYGSTAGSEDEARIAWTEIVEIASEHDGFAIAIGAALGSIFLDAVGSRSFCLNVAGGDESSTTQMLRTAMACVGDPDRLIEPWAAPPRAFNRLRDASVLPVAFSGLSECDEQTLDRLLRGPDPDVPDGESWNLVVFVAGRERVREHGRFKGGLQWIEAPLPVVQDADLARHVHDLATAHHGWPLRWLAHHSALVDMPGWHPQALRTLGRLAPTVAARAVAKHVAACTVGFGALGRVIGQGLAVYAGIAAAERILLRLDREPGAEPRHTEGAYLVGVTPAAGVPTT